MRDREQDYSVRGLSDLMKRFFRPDVPGPRFVVRVIESGLHDLQLRTAHNQYVEFGVSVIERSVRSGMASSELRHDIDPRIAARLLHSITIWWASELQAGAAKLEDAEQVMAMALELLKQTPAKLDGDLSRSRDTLDAVRALLRADPHLPAKDSDAVTRIVEQVYEFATGKSSRSGDEHSHLQHG
jgi:hypothetical protein